MNFIRFGGANKVRQKNKRSPVKKGLWCFPLKLTDLFYLSGTDKIIKGKPTKSHTFSYKGDVWVGVGDIPPRYLHKALKFSDRGDKEWALLPYETFKKVVNNALNHHHKICRGYTCPTNAAFECFIG